MTQRYVSDDYVTICLQGLRWVKKEDTHYTSRQTDYNLQWAYKGSESSHSYASKVERDAMYSAIVEALQGQSTGKAG